MKQRSYAGRHPTSVAVPVPVDGLQASTAWNDSYSHSEAYSSASEYASPIPGAGDFANMFANPPYGAGSVRTRSPSDASFGEPWSYPSCSPTSATSALSYPWTSNDKAASASLAYMNVPLGTMGMPGGDDTLSTYGQFGPKSMMQRDDEEQAYLFPEQSFGMAKIANTFSFEQYLDNYWRLFHPSFPIVHRPTFDRINEAPMLRAAMIAVGAQYSKDSSAKHTSRKLYDQCLKLVEKVRFLAH